MDETQRRRARRRRAYTHRWTWPTNVEREQVVKATCVETKTTLQGPLNEVLRRALADVERGHHVVLYSIERGGRTVERDG